MLSLEGQPAPSPDLPLAALRGKPVLLYLFAEWCGDCKAQGPVLTRLLKEHGPVPGIALSGFGMEEDVKKSKEAGFYEHLTKPINFKRLETAIRDLTARAFTSNERSSSSQRLTMIGAEV